MRTSRPASNRPRFWVVLPWLGHVLVVGQVGCSSVITAIDGGARSDALPDAPVGCGVAPRPLAPTANSVVTTHRPTLRWVAPPGTASVTVELCRDRACARPIDSFVADGASAAVPHALDVGVVFWRLRSTACTDPAAVVSATWEFTVGVADTAVDTAWGAFPDLNGDGYADVAVGVATGPVGAGRGDIAVYLGSAGGPGTTPAVTLTNPGVYFGAYILSVGDLDGDGYGDLAVTGDYAVWVIPGGPRGPTSTAIRQLNTPTGEMWFGSAGSVAGVGDVNADGYADLLVGGSSSRAWLYYGGSAGVPAAPSRTLTAPGVRGFGYSVGAAGDVNGDGYADLVIGAVTDGANSYAASDGAYVFFGGPSGPGTVADRFLGHPNIVSLEMSFGENVVGVGDLNGDGYSDMAVEAANGNSQPAIYLGGPGGPSTPTVDLVGEGYSGVLPGVGDLDGDGFGELAIMGNPDVFVFRGGPTGPTVTATWVIAITRDTVNPAAFAAPAGDVNGDGYFDLVAGDQDQDMEAFLYLGSPAGLTGTPAVTWPDIATGITGVNVAQRWRTVPRLAMGWRLARADDPWRLSFRPARATVWWGG